MSKKEFKCPHCENIVSQVLEEGHELDELYSKVKSGWTAGVTTYTEAFQDILDAQLKIIDYIRKRI